MLINLSNHPVSEWNEIQLSEAVNLYGEVQDMPFPNINPQWNLVDIETLAQQYFESIKKLNPQAVHIMGEMTFCYNLIQKLQEEGIKCIASTTERNVTTKSTGEKLVSFKFIRFRNYF